VPYGHVHYSGSTFDVHPDWLCVIQYICRRLNIKSIEKKIIFFLGQLIFFLVIQVDLGLAESISHHSNSHKFYLNIDLDEQSGQKFSRLNCWPGVTYTINMFSMTCLFLTWIFFMINGVWLLSTYGFFSYQVLIEWIFYVMDLRHLFKKKITSLFVTPQIYTCKGMQKTKLVSCKILEIEMIAQLVIE
jgi:hypothetical protein